MSAMSGAAATGTDEVARILALRSAPRTIDYDDRDCMLYALSTGFGADPLCARELPFVFEKSLQVSPAFATVLGWDFRWTKAANIRARFGVHGECRLRLHRPLAPGGSVETESRILDLVDKGEGKGVLLLIETAHRSRTDGALIATLVNTMFYVGAGGLAGADGRRGHGGPPMHPVPARSPDKVVTRTTLPSQALWYRLNGDRNPLHADPAVAVASKFSRPILHGMCTYGFAARAILEAWCDYRPEALGSFDARFSSPVFPGETLVTESWRDGAVVSFRCRVAERDVVVIDNGRADLN